MSEILLKAQNLTYKYEDGTLALKDINLEIKSGEKLAVLGPNGSGKSTFFLCLNGVRKPQKGTLTLEGKDYDYSRKGLLHLRSNVGIVFQDPDNQLFSAGVYEEIAFGPLNLGLSEAEVRILVDNAIEKLEMSSFQHKPTHFLSGGQKKQVSIADIIVMEPKIIIFDEPTSALDPKHCTLVKEMIEKLSIQGKTVLLSTHDVDYALEWADRIVVFKDGTIEKSGTPEEIFSDLSLLKKTHLEQPKVMQIFYGLQANGILPKHLPVPKTTIELLQYINKN